MKIIKLCFSAIAAWALGLAFIGTTLCATNDGADFTTTDLMGFGTLSLVNRKMSPSWARVHLGAE